MWVGSGPGGLWCARKCGHAQPLSEAATHARERRHRLAEPGHWARVLAKERCRDCGINRWIEGNRG
jgi:hypothetical protein